MRINTSLVRFTVAAIVVVLLGGLAGWYIFVNKYISTTESQDAARGFGVTESFGSSLGSGLSNIVSGIVGNIVNNDNTDPLAAPKLWQVTRTPVAGLGFASSSKRLYFAERASGNILVADPLEAKVERLTNTLVPKVLEASFTSDGSVVLRAIDERGETTTFSALISTSSSPAAGDSPNKLEGIFLPSGIISVAAHPVKRELFFLIRENEGSVGITSTWLGTDQKRILSSSLSDWRIIALADGSRFLVQKPSDDVSGHAFRISSSGALQRVIGNIPGLVLLPRANSAAFAYSSSAGGLLTLFARTGTNSSDITLPVRTVAEKCVWAPETRLILYCAVPQTQPSGTFLRDWYDGSEHSADAIWRIDVSANSAEQIFAPDFNTPLDVEEPRIDSSGTYLAFINGIDKTLWMLSLDR
jgi:hypothetical protein